ncbi:MAG TPA: 23S rRNA (uracil(1939)-C(5))-methyltransferase RlmD [Bacteroidales bacterium]|nr:23S rRNA (uracil(1939)-C(5))-methyltransferase RlmD [Bacteroidales bacterium]
MVGRRKKLPVFEHVLIEDIAAEGKAMARVDEMVVFVKNALPGDVVDLQLTRKRKNFAEAKPVKFHAYSPDRSEPFCEHFADCGGCVWQDLPYEKQLFYKQKQVVDNFERIGKIEIPSINNILPSAKTTLYRNKLEYTFSNRRWLTSEEVESGEEFRDMNGLGFHVPGMFDRIVDIRQCHLQPEPGNSIRLAVRKYAISNNLEFYDPRNHTGFLRNLLIRTSETGEVMVVPVFAHDDRENIEGLLNMLSETFPEITSLQYVVNEKRNDTITDQEVIVWKGKDHIIEQLGDLKFRIGPKSFFQTNAGQSLQLYEKTLEFAAVNKDETVYDLYTGTGSIACFLARQAKEVIGIEYVPEAIEDAKLNAALNNLDNTKFYAGDIKDLLTNGFIDEHGHPDTIVLDPPRPGIHKDVIDALLYAAPEKIVYVSCNPATQARDIALLNEAYTVTKIQPVDMFPHTHHVENIALLVKN